MEMWKNELHVFPHFHSAWKTRRKLRSEFSTVPTASTATDLWGTGKERETTKNLKPDMSLAMKSGHFNLLRTG